MVTPFSPERPGILLVWVNGDLDRMSRRHLRAGTIVLPVGRFQRNKKAAGAHAVHRSENLWRSLSDDQGKQPFSSPSCFSAWPAAYKAGMEAFHSGVQIEKRAGPFG
jgi:hypothetical protein